MPTLLRGINAKRPFRAFLALLLLPIGPAAAAVATGVVGSLPEGTSVLMPQLIATGCSAWGAWEAWSAVRPARLHPGLRALCEQPGAVVWFYGMRQRSGHVLRLHLDTGKIYDLPLCRGGDTGAALAEARALLPQAAEGFSAARQDLFLRAPGELRRS